MAKKKLPFGNNKIRNDNHQHRKKLTKASGTTNDPGRTIADVVRIAKRAIGRKLGAKGNKAIKRATKARKK